MDRAGEEWFAHEGPDGSPPGLAFACTQCGNCCTGSEGFVLVSDAEADALAARLSLSRAEFLDRYTHDTIKGRSLVERLTPHGHDCVFLDRGTIPGKAVCSVYEHRPTQCRTWPFWNSTLASRHAWERAARTCPGINTGQRRSPQQIRVLRDQIDI